MSTIAVTRALALPPEEVGAALLGIAEDQWFDRKSSRITPRDLGDKLIGFANADGGTVVVGLHSGAVEGIDDRGVSRRNEFQQVPLDHADPPLPSRWTLVVCVNSRGEPDHLLVFDVDPSTSVHRSRRDEVFLRVGDENRRLTYSQRRELEYDKGQTWYEATPVSDATWAEVDEALTASYADAMGAPDARRLVQARGLVDTADRLTIGALLLFGLEPQGRFPHSLVRISRFRGSHRGTGARQELLSDVRCEGPIPLMLDDAQREIFDRVPTRQALGEDGRFGPVGLIPRDAWLEGLVNAVVHRSYSLAGDHIRVDIFDDRLEIESPGRFPGVVDLNDPKRITRFARNPRIARVCSDLRFGVERGEGIRRIFEEMRLAGLADPDYTQTSGSVRLTLTTMAVDRELESRLPPGGRELIRAVREAERPSTGELVAATGLSRPAVLLRLRALEELDLVEWVGRSKKDPRAYWRSKL
jgi:ATP-dependent DNA helicase RecG